MSSISEKSIINLQLNEENLRNSNPFEIRRESEAN